MDGLCRAAGSGATIMMGERTMILSPLTIKMHGMIEQEILKRRDTPLKRIKRQLDGLSDDERKMLLEKAYDDERLIPNYATPDELEAFFTSVDGISYMVWMMLRREHKDVELDWVEEYVGIMTNREIENLTQLIKQVNGYDELGEGTGPTNGRAQASKEADSTGVSSTAASAKRTRASRRRKSAT